MKRYFELSFYNFSEECTRKIVMMVCNYTPRNNEYEKKLKYSLRYACWQYEEGTNKHKVIPLHSTGYCFSTIKEAKQFAMDNKFMFLR